jgi:hypothetical protein
MSVDTQALRRLRANHARLERALAEMTAERDVQVSILDEALPAPADRTAAAQRVARAMAADALAGTSTVDATRAECAEACKAANQELAASRSRRTTAAARKAEAEAAIAELEVMLAEADKATREEMSRQAVALLPDAAARYYSAVETMIGALAEWSATQALCAEREPVPERRGVRTGFAVTLPRCESNDPLPERLGDFAAWNSLQVSTGAGAVLAQRRYRALRAEMLGESA